MVTTIPRAIQGAYVKGLNEFGCGRLRNAAGDIDNGWTWDSGNAYKPKTEAECFTEVTENNGRGDIAGNLSGHPDGIFYDGITAGGLNGVIDWRLPAVANDSPEEAAKVQAKVENKTYRGLQKLVYTKVIETTRFSAGFGATSYYFTVGNVVENSSKSYVIGDDGTPYECVITNTTPESLCTINARYGNVSANLTGNLRVVNTYELNLSVSGEFSTQMVIGDPANIL